MLLPAFASPDDNLSGLSGMEVDDRISYLEQRLQLQEDEIQVLKAALADVLRRLSTCEENGLNLSKRRPDKGIRMGEGLRDGPLQVPECPEVRPQWSARQPGLGGDLTGGRRPGRQGSQSPVPT